jgi:hypothetical protein
VAAVVTETEVLAAVAAETEAPEGVVIAADAAVVVAAVTETEALAAVAAETEVPEVVVIAADAAAVVVMVAVAVAVVLVAVAETEALAVVAAETEVPEVVVIARPVKKRHAETIEMKADLVVDLAAAGTETEIVSSAVDPQSRVNKQHQKSPKENVDLSQGMTMTSADPAFVAMMTTSITRSIRQRCFLPSTARSF